jgi:hypothetical protein
MSSGSRDQSGRLRVGRLQAGDEVREGMGAATVMDVETILVQVRTTEGRVRLLCPFELVKTRFG